MQSHTEGGSTTLHWFSHAVTGWRIPSVIYFKTINWRLLELNNIQFKSDNWLLHSRWTHAI